MCSESGSLARGQLQIATLGWLPARQALLAAAAVQRHRRLAARASSVSVLSGSMFSSISKRRTVLKLSESWQQFSMSPPGQDALGKTFYLVARGQPPKWKLVHVQSHI